MSQQGEAAEQIVNMATNVTVKGVECVTNLAGKGALSLATFLIATLKDQKKTQGKARMRAFHGKPTKDWNKSIAITAYAETREQSRLIDEYLRESKAKFKRIVSKK